VAGEQPGEATGAWDEDERPLVCPSCAREHPSNERFCKACGMPLVHMTAAGAGAEAVLSERQQRARKIKPQYSEGKLVKIASAQNGVEAEMIQGLLLEEGIPSMSQRAPGADVPDFLVAGRRDILVPESGAQAAREALAWKPETAAED
jgi:Putative prokaryotic signal transducing protein